MPVLVTELMVKEVSLSLSEFEAIEEALNLCGKVGMKHETYVVWDRAMDIVEQVSSTIANTGRE